MSYNKLHKMIHTCGSFPMTDIASDMPADKDNDVHGYTLHYDAYFSSIRDNNIRILELGVKNGGSISLWESYFPRCRIYGVDINPKCRVYESDKTSIFIGDISDQKFISDMVSKTGGNFDIVIDDASHVCSHQIMCFESLFPCVNEHGVYIVEDIYTSYFKRWGGGIKSQKSFIAYIRTLIDKIHHDAHKDTPIFRKYFSNNFELPIGYIDAIDLSIHSIHIFNGVCFIFRGVS